MNISRAIILSFITCSCMAAPPPTLEVRTISIPPYGFTQKQQQEISYDIEQLDKDSVSSAGIYYDLANMIVREAGYKSVNYILPYARIIKGLKRGSIDITIMFKYKELTDHVTYIAPLPTLKNVVIGLEGSFFKSAKDLEGKSIAYLRGAKFSDIIDNNPNIFKHETVNFSQGLKLLSKNRVDAIIGPMDPIIAAAQRDNKLNISFGKPLIVSERTPWLQISKKSKTKFSIEHLARAFNTVTSKGGINKLREKYIKKK